MGRLAGSLEAHQYLVQQPVLGACTVALGGARRWIYSWAAAWIVGTSNVDVDKAAIGERHVGLPTHILTRDSLRHAEIGGEMATTVPTSN